MPGSIVGAIVGSKSSKKAAKTQAGATVEAARIQQESQRETLEAIREMFDIQREDLAPFREEGLSALQQLGEQMEPGGYFQQDFTFGLEDFQADPGYQFRVSEGRKEIERSATARGIGMSGRTLKELERFRQGLASEEYGRAYGRAAGEFFGNREARFNRLASLAGVGQTASTVGAQLAGQTGRDIAGVQQATGARLSDLALQRGNVRASGYMGQAQAWQPVFENIDRAVGFTLGALI